MVDVKTNQDKHKHNNSLIMNTGMMKQQMRNPEQQQEHNKQLENFEQGEEQSLCSVNWFLTSS